MRVAIYGRVSTTDKGQNPETQLAPLREYAAAQGWTVAGEFVDHASATNLRKRPAWSEVLALASRRRVDAILVWKLDRVARSVVHAVSILESLRRWNVGLRSLTESWVDTTNATPASDLVFNILASVAQFERALIGERVRAGMQRAKKQGRHIGRYASLNGNLDRILPEIDAGTLTVRGAARSLGVSHSTVLRTLVRKGHRVSMPQTPAGSFPVGRSES